MRDKYVEERFPRYFEFGMHPAIGMVDVASCKNDTVATVSKQHLANLVKDRDEVLDMLCLLARTLDQIAPETFNKIWYT
uniref:Uncharacterized protein n=1 Tax=viral metagenome TaxID=1070528 RepID=A0A6M3XMP9_9ZZZZ